MDEPPVVGLLEHAGALEGLGERLAVLGGDAADGAVAGGAVGELLGGVREA